MSEKKTEAKAIEKTTKQTEMQMFDGDVESLYATVEPAEILKAGGVEETWLKMEEGSKIHAFWVGSGPGAFEDGVELFKHPTLNVIMTINSDKKLKQKLTPHPVGALLYVEKLEQENIAGGKRVNNWRVIRTPGKTLANLADFAVKPQFAAPALPAHVPAPANGAQATGEAVPF